MAPIFCFGQQPNYQNFHAIRQEQIDFLEGEGCQIFIEKSNLPFNGRGLYYIKKKYSIVGNEQHNDSIDSLPCIKLVTIDSENYPFGTYVHYILPNQTGGTTVIGFGWQIARRIDFEESLVYDFIKNKIPPSIYTNQELDTVDFVGRKLKVYSECRWMSPHNIQCPYMGQMNWSIFDNESKAKEYQEGKLKINTNIDFASTLSEKWIELKIEGVKTRAFMRTVKINVPQLKEEGSDILITYYVVAKIRGKFIACVLSHYSDDINAENVPPFLNLFFEF
jgi:hypothetical protein